MCVWGVGNFSLISFPTHIPHPPPPPSPSLLFYPSVAVCQTVCICWRTHVRGPRSRPSVCCACGLVSNLSGRFFSLLSLSLLSLCFLSLSFTFSLSLFHFLLLSLSSHPRSHKSTHVHTRSYSCSPSLFSSRSPFPSTHERQLIGDAQPAARSSAHRLAWGARIRATCLCLL